RRAAAAGGVHGVARPERARRLPGGRDAHPQEAPRTAGLSRESRIMSTTVKSLTYRGDVKAAVGVGGTLLFVTVHPEGHPTGVYRLDTEKLSLTLDALPAGATALLNEKDVLWIA